MRAGWLLIVVFFLLCGVARADVVDDNPAAAALGPGNVYVFARGADGAVLYRHLANGAWSDWAAIPGLVGTTSGPAAAVVQGTVQVFVRGPGDLDLWQASLQDGRWSAWVVHDTSATSAPAVTKRRGRDVLDVAVRGADNAIWHASVDPALASPLSAWESIGGNWSVAPTVTSYSDDEVEFFARGSGPLYGRSWVAGNWTAGWDPIFGDTIVGAPAAVSRVDDRFDVFARGTDRAIWQLSYDRANGWTGWQPVDWQLVGSSPGVVSDHATRLMLFARVGEELWTKTFTTLPTGSWSAWTSLGKVQVPAPRDVTISDPVSPDKDNDGVLDPGDRCALLVGPAARSGCPKGVLADPSIRYRAGKNSIRVVAYYVKATTGARIVVTCSRGCKRSVATGRGAKAVRIKALNGRTLKNGTKITVTATLAGRLTTTVIDRVSKGRRVEGRPRCVPVGC